LASKSSDSSIEGRLLEINQFLTRVSRGDDCGELKLTDTGAIRELEQLINEMICNHRIDLDNAEEERDYLNQCLLEQSQKYQVDELKVAELTDQAADLAKSKSQFLATMNQDIRTPMNGILGITQILMNMPMGGSQRDYVQIIHQSNKSLLSAINDLLDFSQVESGDVEIESISFDLEMACYEVAEILQSKVREKQLELVVRYSPRLPKQFKGDPARVRQILLNLMGNAIKYTHTGHVLVEAKLLEQDGELAQVSLKVEDTGQGVDPTTQEKIFGSFTDEGSASTPQQKYGDPGVGLVICKRLVDLMGGDLYFESELGHGSTFLFTLPLKLDKKPDNLPRHELGGVKILVVESNLIYSSVHRDLLVGFSMQPVVVSTAEEALLQLREASKAGSPFQICLVADPMRSGKSKAFAKHIRKDSAIDDVALVVLSNESKRGDAAKFKKAGYSAYLTTPIVPENFRDTLAAALASLKAPSSTAPIITKYHIAETDTSIDQLKLQLAGHVLLAEDIKVSQAVTKAMLRRLGLEVTTVSTGSEAIKACMERAFDLILMDCQMPEIDGMEAARRIRRMEREKRLDRETPIIAMAVNVLPTDRQACLDVGMNDCLPKPFTKGVLVRSLCAHLRPKKSNSEEIIQLSNPDSCVDWVALKELKKVMGDQFIDMIPAFSETSEAIIGQLDIADPDDGLMTVERLAQSLSSISSGVGAVGLLSLAKMLEMQAKEGKVVALSRQVKELRGAFTKAKSVLEEYHSKYPRP